MNTKHFEECEALLAKISSLSTKLSNLGGPLVILRPRDVKHQFNLLQLKKILRDLRRDVWLYQWLQGKTKHQLQLQLERQDIKVRRLLFCPNLEKYEEQKNAAINSYLIIKK